MKADMWTLHTDRTWKHYGKKEPYYAIFGQDMYFNSNLNDQILNDVFTSGNDYVEELFTTIHAKIDSGFKPKNILDFGCGPGRFIIPFSKYTDEITGMDISQDMLDEAARNCQKFNVTNASFFLSDDSLNSISRRKFDLVHSFIVLQHINIKRGEKLIKLLLNSIQSNGIGVLHVTYYDNFKTRRMVNFLRNRIPFLSDVLRLARSLFKGKKYKYLPQMQMNNYDLNKVFQLLQKERVKEVYSTFTNHYDYFGITLIFKKP